MRDRIVNAKRVARTWQLARTIKRMSDTKVMLLLDEARRLAPREVWIDPAGRRWEIWDRATAAAWK